MPQLAIDATCLAQYEKLDQPTRERLKAATRKFRELPLDALLSHPDLRIQALPSGQDPRLRTFRISDTWTGVMLAPESGETFLLVHLLPRESAEDWAGDQRHDVNSVMGTLERRDATALEKAGEKAGLDEPFEEIADEEAAKPAGGGEAPLRDSAPSAALFDHVSRHDLRRLGIDPEIMRFGRSLSSPRELHDWGAALPQDQYEVLAALAEGHSVERVLKEVVAPRRPAIGAVADDDYDAAIRHTRERAIVVNDDRELEDILAGEFNAWRIYLHPKQRDLAYRARFNGPAKVSGGPGTGKTVVALHRTAYLLYSDPRLGHRLSGRQKLRSRPHRTGQINPLQYDLADRQSGPKLVLGFS
jgi:hypothetical protein